MRTTAKMGLVAATFALLVASGCGDDDLAGPPGPAVNAVGTWDVTIDFYGSPLVYVVVINYMAADGTIAGGLDGPQGFGTLTGSLSGYVLSITSTDTDTGDVTWLTGYADIVGTSVGGAWDNDYANSGYWYGTKR